MTLLRNENNIQSNDTKKSLLIEQSGKLQEIIRVLQVEFASENLNEEINFLTIVNENLRKLAE